MTIVVAVDTVVAEITVVPAEVALLVEEEIAGKLFFGMQYNTFL